MQICVSLSCLLPGVGTWLTSLNIKTGKQARASQLFDSYTNKCVVCRGRYMLDMLDVFFFSTGFSVGVRHDGPIPSSLTVTTRLQEAALNHCSGLTEK